MSELSRAQVDRLGERLRVGETISPEDRIILDQYRRSLASFSHAITQALQQLLGRPITERPGKTTPSIIAKLKRQSTTLSRMQDVAGGRVVVDDLAAQDAALAKVVEIYPTARIVDRRQSPVVGYHAVHFVIREGARSYELQIRTEAQQRWAQLSEKFADLFGFEIKYGGGNELLSRYLTSSGRLIHVIERFKHAHKQLLEVEDELSRRFGEDQRNHDREHLLDELTLADNELAEAFSRLESVILDLETGMI